MLKNTTTYFFLLLLVSTYQQTYTMDINKLSTNVTHLSDNFSETIGSWISLDSQPIPQVELNIPENNNVQPPAAGPSQWALYRDISGNAAQVVAGVPAATKAVIDVMAVIQREDKPAQPIVFSPELLAQQEAEHVRSQDQLRFIGTLVQDTGITIDRFTHMLMAGTQFAQHAAIIMQTFQPNPADKGKEEAACPRKAFLFQEKQRIADRQHIDFLGRQAMDTLYRGEALIHQTSRLAKELNTGLTTYAGMLAKQPATTPEEKQMIREHERTQTERHRAIACYGSTIFRNIANTAKSFENMFTSPHFANHASHIGKVATDTTVRLALTGAGLYVFCRNIQDVDKQKNALLAGLGGAMMLSPLVLARLTNS